jgi:hypothetical protein
MSWLNRLYDRRFGRVRTSHTDADYGWIVGAVTGILAQVDRSHLGHGWPSFALLALAVWPIRTVIRSWPYRAYHVVNVVAAVLGSMMYTAVRLPADGGPWIARCAVLAGLGYMLTGLLDHQLLVRVLGGPRDDEEAARETAIR